MGSPWLCLQELLYLLEISSQAEAAATQIIENESLFTLDSLNRVFLATSNEAIWQLKPVGNGPNSNTGEEN